MYPLKGPLLEFIEDKYIFAAKYEEIRVFGENSRNKSNALEVCKLSIGFIWGNDILHIFCLECLRVPGKYQ